jgi:hypothetical protein
LVPHYRQFCAGRIDPKLPCSAAALVVRVTG